MNDLTTAMIFAGFVAFAWGSYRLTFGRQEIASQDLLHPRYEAALYTELKTLSEEPLSVQFAPASEGQVNQLKRSIKRLTGARSYASQMNFYSSHDPDGSECIWRLDYLAPDKFHALQMVGEGIDEWLIDGPKVWFGPIWMEASSDDFFHAKTQFDVDVRQ